MSVLRKEETEGKLHAGAVEQQQRRESPARVEGVVLTAQMIP